MDDSKRAKGPSDLTLVLVGLAIVTLLALGMVLSEPEAPSVDHGHDAPGNANGAASASAIGASTGTAAGSR